MKNQQILKQRLETINNYLDSFLDNYKNINAKTQDNLQDLFSGINIDYSEINNPVSPYQKQKLDRQLLEWKEQGLFNSVFGYEANKILRRVNVTYSEMLEILIMGIYIEENKRMFEFSKEIFTELVKDSYEQALDEIKPKNRKMIINPLIYAILNIPILNATPMEYLEALALTNANEMYKSTLINMQSQMKLNINNSVYRQLTIKQRNRYLSINDSKTSGGIDDIIWSLYNNAFLQAGKDNNMKQIRFISDLCPTVTEMCENMNNMIFNVDDWNEFDRYIGTNAKDVKWTRIKVKGLEPGMNLPPIRHHFHWCHSMITYLI